MGQGIGSAEVVGVQEPAGDARAAREIMGEIEFLIDPVFDFGRQELVQLREKFAALKTVVG